MTDGIEQATTQTTQQAPTAPTLDLNFEPRIIFKEIPYRDGVVKIEFYQATRLMRNKAMLEAVDVYRREHPGQKDGEGLGGDPTVLERELACRMIKWWNLPKTPRQTWDWLPVDLGDLIVEALEIQELFAFTADKTPSGATVTKLSEEAEKAKN